MTKSISPAPEFIIPPLPMNILTIREYLPHRYPFLLVDRVTGHFPTYPIMPGVLIIEALAQVSGIFSFILVNETPKDGSIFLFAGAEKIRFKKQVVAGDQLILKSELVMQKRGIYKYHCTASVDGIVAVTAEIMISYQKIEQT